jgi:2-keto-4-pentenoate hydratase/2-oxohepta-3-ene-1,7-dioic acid hydratase in catechol pathway
MKFYALEGPSGARVGVQRGDEIVLLPEALGDLVAIIAAGSEGMAAVRNALAGKAPAVPLSQAKLLAPINRFRRDILCTGWNYWDHFEEGRDLRPNVERPIAPTFFSKGPDSVLPPYADIGIDPSITVKWDYEAEFAVIIGKAGRSIPRSRALEHVFGMTLANDISQRDLQRRHGGQWFKGKSIDASMPLGPFVLTADEFDFQNARIRCEVNGEMRQDASIAQMAFNLSDLIAELSLGMTLHPGDVLITGTPSGIGNARKPPVYLKKGDVVKISGTGLGEQVNRIIEVDLRGDSDVVINTPEPAK